MRRYGVVLLISLGLVSCGDPPPRLEGAILIVLDTLRADHLSSYGHERETPHIDSLARSGVVFENASSHSSWTLPAFAGLLAGRYPTGEVFTKRLQSSLVEDLQRAGFTTVALTEGGFASRRFGFDRGFDAYLEEEGPVRLYVDGIPAGAPAWGSVERTFDTAIRWLEQNADERFFLLVHTYEVHVPYRRVRFTQGVPSGVLDGSFELHDLTNVRKGAIEIGEEERAYLSALYDGGVAVADEHVGKLLAALETLGRAGDTLVVLTSDHGEELGDRFPEYAGDHGHSLYEELVRVPLVVRDPTRDGPAGRVTATVRLVDVLPTILDLLHVETTGETEGKSLGPLMTGGDDLDRAAFAELERYGPFRRSLREGRWKLVATGNPEAPRLELFDLGTDPRELENLADGNPDVLDRMALRLGEVVTGLASEGRPDYALGGVADDLRERLDSLGYAE